MTVQNNLDPPLPAVEMATGDKPDATVIWLHGLGADGHDFEPIVPHLGLDTGPGVRFIFPHASVRPVTINGGMPMRAWYDIAGVTINDRTDETGVRESAEICEKFIERERARGIDMKRIVLAGFSQGGAIALSCALRLDQPLAGVIALSTYLPMPDKTAVELSDGGRCQRIFMAHGTQDPVVPIAMGRATHEWLKGHKIDVQWREYPMPHAVSPEEIQDIGEFLENQLRS